MDSTTQFVIILLEQTVLFGGLFYQNYYSEKGKLKALEEQTEKITGLQEAVKIQLQLKNHIQTRLHEEMRAAAIGQYEILNLWRHTALFIEIDAGLTNEKVINNQNRFLDFRDKFVTGLSKLELYIGIESVSELFRKAENLITEITLLKDDLQQKQLILSEEYQEHYRNLKNAGRDPITVKQLVGILNENIEVKEMAEFNINEKVAENDAQLKEIIEQIRQQVFKLISSE